MTGTAVSDPPRTGWFGRLVAALRQRFYLREFRIAPAVWPAGLEETFARVQHLVDALEAQRSALADEHRALEEERGAGPGKPPPPPPPPVIEDRALVDAAIGVWRTQRKLDASSDGGALARQLRRHLSGAWDGLAKLEVVTQSHDQEAFDSGMSLEVLAFEPRAGLTRETIIETVQPTVYRSDRVISMGQVIVGQPDGSSSS